MDIQIAVNLAIDAVTRLLAAGIFLTFAALGGLALYTWASGK